MSLQTPPTVRKLQRALYAKAKEAPEYRFYQLYDKVYRTDILRHAYDRSKANDGTAGVDGQGFSDIEAYGEERWLGELAKELKEKSYRPQAIRRVWIEKESGGQRPLGIPTIRDRVVQMAVVLVIEPIFEADLQPEQYGYRPKRSAQDAVREVHRLIQAGHREVIDGDLSGYFDSIPHGDLMKSVSPRISDRYVLHLIKQWLKAPIQEEPKGKGGSRELGTPQGAPISPLLANLYMRRLIMAWKKLGYEQRLDAHFVNYADDFVVCCRRSAGEGLEGIGQIVTRLRLTLNSTKTRLCRLPEESFDFLGYTIGRCYRTGTGQMYLGTRPARKRVMRLCRRISEQTARNRLTQETADLVVHLNRQLVGWANYFCLGSVSRAYRAVDAHTRQRLRQWLCRKHKLEGKGTHQYSDAYLYDVLGLVRLSQRTANFPWAKA